MTSITTVFRTQAVSVSATGSASRIRSTASYLCDGVEDEEELSEANVEAAAAGSGLVISAGTYNIDNDLTFTVPVIFDGGVLTLAAGVTVTFNEPYVNPTHAQCFDEQDRTPDTAGGVKIALANPQTIVSPLDWGADNTGAADSFYPIQQAIDAVSYTRSVYKVGIVEIQSGDYYTSQGLFIGYDFVSYPLSWTNRSQAWDGTTSGTLICDAAHADTPMGRKQRVLLHGIGRVVIKGLGNPPSSDYNPYLLYDAYDDNSEGFEVVKNIVFDGNNWRWRGMYAHHLAYCDTIKDVEFYRTQAVGLDWIDSWGCRLINVFCLYCNGHGIRTHRANSCSVDTLKLSGYGLRDEHWPDPAETFIRDQSGNAVQTAVEDRANLYLSGNISTFRNAMLETVANGSPMSLLVADDGVTCTQVNHGLGSGDPLWYPTAVGNEATTVLSVTNSSTFVVDDTGSSGLQPIYRRATNITKATPAVVTCQNHGIATGQRVKILGGSMGAELVAGGPWYVITKIDDDSFSLQDFYGNDVESGSYSESDGSEYLVYGHVGIYFAGQSSILSTVRFEGNDLPYAKILLANGFPSTVVDQISSGDGIGDWIVESRGVLADSRITNCYGYADRAGVLLRADPTDHMVVGNHIDNIAGTTMAAAVEFDVEGSAEEQIDAVQGNYIQGIWTPITAKASDTTPSVWGFRSSDDWLSAYRIRTYGPTLRIPDETVTITNFINGINGQRLSVLFLGSNVTIENGATIVTSAGGDASPAANDLMEFHNVEGVWYEI